MSLPRVLSERRFKRVAIAVATLTLVLLVINVFVIGGDAFVYTVNSSLNAPLALIVVISAAAIWRRMRTERQSRRVWAGFLVGWTLWALAEALWALYSLLDQEVPYPSLADLFWVAGYIPMGIGLFVRVRSMPVRRTPSQHAIIWGVSAATILITSVFIFAPILSGFDPQRLVERVLDFTYPLADLFLVTIVWWMFFAYEKGDYGFSWRLLTAGFVLMTVADMFFAYATWQELYYPDMEANAISRLAADFPYTTSYLVWFLGIYALHTVLRARRPGETSILLRMVPRYGHILVYLKDDGSVLSVSPNAHRLLATRAVEGRSLAEALALPKQDELAILERLRVEGKVADLPLRIRDRSGSWRDVQLCGIAVLSPQGDYSGANILLRIGIEDVSFDETLEQTARSMVRYLLDRSGSGYRAEIGAFLLDYYRAHLKALLELVHQQGGKAMDESLLDELRKKSQEHRWPLQFNLQTVLDGDYPLEILRDALPALLETAKQFTSRVTDPTIVDNRMGAMSRQFGQAVHRDVACFGMQESEVRFADSRDDG